MEVNWLFFAAVVIFTYLLFAVVIPFGFALGYSCKWNVWFRNISKLDKDHNENSESKKEKPHTDLGSNRKQ